MDQSYLDQKYFITTDVFNCPFCNRRNIKYTVTSTFEFNWNDHKKCVGFLTKCSHCDNKAMHLSYELKFNWRGSGVYDFANASEDIDSQVFYSVPSSFFVIDNRIPKIIRELITEAEGSLKMNFLTGASACIRKAIYELMIHENCEAPNYDDKIKELKAKYPNTDTELFEILGHIKDMASDKVHEQSWDKWDSSNLNLIIETLKAVLHDIYVIPEIKKERTQKVRDLKAAVFKKDNPLKVIPFKG